MVAAAGVVLMLVGLLTKSWLTMSQGIEVSIGLRSVEMCHPIISGCQTVSFSDSQMDTAQSTPAFFVWAQLTFWLGMVTLVAVCVAVGNRVTGGEEKYSQWVAIACGVSLLLGFVTLVSFPDQPGVPSGEGFSVSWSPFVFFLGAGLALVGSLPPTGAATPEKRAEPGSPSADFEAQYGVVRRSDRLGSAATDAVAPPRSTEPIPLSPAAAQPVSNVPATSVPESVDPVEEAFSIGDLIASPDGSKPGRSPAIELEATIARFGRDGLTTIDADGERRLRWLDVIAVAVRRMPDEMANGSLFVDIIADYEGGHLPKPFRLTATTHGNYDVFGLPDDFEHNARLLVTFIRRTNPEIQLDKRTAGFVEHDPPRQFPSRAAYEYYQKRYEG